MWCDYIYASAVLGFAHRHVSLTVAVLALNKDLNFDHH
jgi:hypothetical protein